MASSDRTEKALVRRMAALDTEPQPDPEWPSDIGGDGCNLLSGHFATVMGRWTDATVETEAGRDAAITPAAADALTCNSRLLAGIARHESSVVTGPIDVTRQQWTPLNGTAAYTGESPSRRAFVAPRAHQPAAVKPAGVGLYTSTVCVSGVSMWRAFLGLGSTTALSLPRYTWDVSLDEPLTVAEITTATGWAEFVCAHPRYEGGVIYPDWVDVARSFDGVHITLSAIAAVQGFALLTENGMIAPAFWDVETTFWVRWRVLGAQLIEGR